MQTPLSHSYLGIDKRAINKNEEQKKSHKQAQFVGINVRSTKLFDFSGLSR